jgi:hypothetical protein
MSHTTRNEILVLVAPAPPGLHDLRDLEKMPSIVNTKLEIEVVLFVGIVDPHRTW